MRRWASSRGDSTILGRAFEPPSKGPKMRPEVSLVFKLGQFFGFSPFVVRRRRIHFSLCSWQTVYFAAVAAFIAAHVAVAVR